MVNQDIAERACREVDRIKLSRHLNDHALAAKYKVAPSVVAQWRVGIAAPSADMLSRLHRAGADVMYIVTGERRQTE